jgi:hypothetical protein
MNFNDHFHLKDQHAFLSPSKYHWLNYDEEKLSNVFQKYQAAKRGTELHELAHKCIELGVKLPRTNKTLNMYVNDGIGFKMKTEQPLFYSENCFGTADTISFRKNFLRIHDYKSGQTPASIKQLYIYAALFCLEYRINPFNIENELRIYQSDQILVDRPNPEEIKFVMDKIVVFDKKIEEIKALGG